jgi:RluA family pseudouridine synthase
MSSARQELRFEVGAPDQGVRLDAFLAERLSWRSRSEVQDLIAGDRVAVAGAAPATRVRAALRLVAGSEVLVSLDAAFAEAAARDGAEQLPDANEAVEVVFEDDDLLAVNKPPEVSLYPTRRHRTGSLIELVHRARSRRMGAPPSPCHRLDRDTSGLLLFAKNLPARAHLGRQFEERTVRKTYLAVVAGSIGDECGEIDLSLGRDPSSRVEIRMAPRAGGRPARTRWKVIFRGVGRTLVELSPESGRQHQLRAHLAAIGHPILGDKLYLGGDALFLASLERELTAEEIASLGHGRQALHAWRLELEHPRDGHGVVVEAPLWPDLALLVNDL